MNAGNAYSFYKTDKQKQIVFKWWATVQLYAETNCHGWLKMTVNEKSSHFPRFVIGLQKILSQLDVEL